MKSGAKIAFNVHLGFRLQCDANTSYRTTDLIKYTRVDDSASNVTATDVRKPPSYVDGRHSFRSFSLSYNVLYLSSGLSVEILKQ